jgi:Virulence factor
MPRPGREGGRRGGSQLVVISWRDIPAQINGQVGEERHQVMLPHRFQKAIDRAAMVADKKTSHEYVAEWQRAARALPDDADVAQATEEAAAKIEADYPNERLHLLVNNGGWQHDPTHQEPPT